MSVVSQPTPQPPAVAATPAERAGAVRQAAVELGFDMVGVAAVSASPHADAYRAWIAAGRHGDMHYLASTLEARVDLASKLPWARSVVSVALSYFSPETPAAAPPAGAGDGSPPPCPSTARIARYARGRDYHTVMDKKLRKFEKRVRELVPPGPGEELHIRTWSDSGPINDREYAQRAGLGWTGKSTLLIHPAHGTYFVLGELVTSLELAPDTPMADHCGTCTRCIDACPTGAIAPYSVDARRCISYLTLETRAAIPAEFHDAVREANFIVGCDICQEVCPFNRQPMATTHEDFLPQGIAADPELPPGRVRLPVIQQWDEQAWDVATRGKAHRRAKLPMWQRTADILLSSPGH